MKLTIYQINTFTNKLFSGNPAAVCLLVEWLTDAELQNIASNNKMPVTAFLISDKDHYQIRWFTPDYELDLCGHGTLAAAWVIFNKFKAFDTVDLISRGKTFSVKYYQDTVTLDFPAQPIEGCDPDPILIKGLGQKPREVYQYKNERYIVVFRTQQEIERLQPDFNILKQIEHRGITVTAPSKRVDFVSRTFYPKKTFTEDAVTGAAHCCLVPYWAEKLQKNNLHAWQISPRSGELFCVYQVPRILMSGKAILSGSGTITHYS